MTSPEYKRPPITEAVIEIAFTQPHDRAKRDKFIKKHKTVYADCQKLESHSVKVGIDVSNQGNAPKTEQTMQYADRFASGDMTQQLLITESSFVIFQLAPYCGWKEYLSRFGRDWGVWKKYMGFKEIKQIGVRYINRIDVPTVDDTVNFSEYVNIYPKIPGDLGPNINYGMQVHIPIDKLNSILNLQSAVVDSPLVNNLSLVLDQDIVRTNDLPQNDDAIYDYLEAVHCKKNAVFESVYY